MMSRPCQVKNSKAPLRENCQNFRDFNFQIYLIRTDVFECFDFEFMEIWGNIILDFLKKWNKLFCGQVISSLLVQTALIDTRPF